METVAAKSRPSRKGPALITRFKESERVAAELREQVAKLTKEKENNEYHRKSAEKRADLAEKEIEQCHAFLDAVPNPPATKVKREDSYSETSVSMMTRLAVYLAHRA